MNKCTAHIHIHWASEFSREIDKKPNITPKYVIFIVELRFQSVKHKVILLAEKQSVSIRRQFYRKDELILWMVWHYLSDWSVGESLIASLKCARVMWCDGHEKINGGRTLFAEQTTEHMVWFVAMNWGRKYSTEKITMKYVVIHGTKECFTNFRCVHCEFHSLQIAYERCNPTYVVVCGPCGTPHSLRSTHGIWTDRFLQCISAVRCSLRLVVRSNMFRHVRSLANATPFLRSDTLHSTYNYE